MRTPNRGEEIICRKSTLKNAYDFFSLVYCFNGVPGTGIRGLMRGMTTLLQGNQELLMVRDKVGRPPGELGVSKSMECDIFHSVL